MHLRRYKRGRFYLFLRCDSRRLTITKYVGTNSVVTIPSFYDDGTNGAKFVLSVGKNAFQNSTITKVIFGEGVVGIGENAFYNCESLKSIAFPDNVTSFGTQVFTWCSALTSVQLPNVCSKDVEP